jgi:hypothetical protein
MKTFKVHLIWACVTVVSAAAWGKWVLHTRDAETVQRRDLLPRGSAATAAAMTPPVVPAEESAQTSLPAPAAAKPGDDLEARILPVEEIRRLLHSTVQDDLWKAFRLVSLMTNSPLKTELVRKMLESKEAWLRGNALSLLTESVPVEAAAPICQDFLRSDPSRDVRERAARLICWKYARGSEEALLHAFEKEDLPIQVLCAGELSKLGHPGPAAQLVPRIAPGLDSADGAVRREAAEQLNKLRSPQALPLLARALRDSNADVRQEAIDGLWKFEDPRLASLLEPLLNDPIRTVRESAKELYDNLKQRQE